MSVVDSKQKSRRVVAETVATDVIDNSAMESVLVRVNFEVLVTAIEAALKERDERAARIAETIPETKFDLDHEPALTEQQIRNAIAPAIRNEDTNAS